MDFLRFSDKRNTILGKNSCDSKMKATRFSEKGDTILRTVGNNFKFQHG